MSRPQPPILEAKFPFLREDVYLVAQVNPETGKQVLRMQKIDPLTGQVTLEDALDCIHAAVCTLPAGELSEMVGSEDFAGHVLSLRSSELLKEIHLAPAERYLAFRSWVAGIAEAGMAAFDIQGDIDTAARLQYPITGRLLRFMARVDPVFLPEYLDYVDRTSQHEGVRHRAYLMASLSPVLEILAGDAKILHREETLETLFDLQPPLEMFSMNWTVFRKLVRENPTFLPRYLARVHEVTTQLRRDRPLAVDEWLPVVLCPVLDALGWVGDPQNTVQEQLLQRLLALDPPAELFAGFGALFRYFVLKSPSFLPRYMERVEKDRAGKRSGDEAWLISVLRPAVVILDYMETPIHTGGIDLWQDILGLDPPVDFLVQNWHVVGKKSRHDIAFLQYYVSWVQKLRDRNQATDASWLSKALRPAIDTLLGLISLHAPAHDELWAKIAALNPPPELLRREESQRQT